MNSDIRFLPYEEAHTKDAAKLIVCDCYYHRGLNLTHLYSERVPGEYRSNTSTETVLKWLADESFHKVGIGAEYVTCNHWDIDGMLSVWCVLNREVALRHRDLLVAAAHLGDFREFDHTSSIGLDALKLCCLLNFVEARDFCLPFGDIEGASIEHEVSIHKFERFLPKLADWIERLDMHEALWRAEYDEVLTDIAKIEGGLFSIIEYAQPGISFASIDIPLHYYALFSHVKGGAVLTELTQPHYVEFEYRYETAVGRLDRTILERIDLAPVAVALNALEATAGVRWCFDNVNEGGTMLRPEFIASPLTREDRYQNLAYLIRRGRAPSTSIDADVVLQMIFDQYKK